MTAAWPAELDLLAACCRWPPSPAREAAVRAAAAGAIDWNRFERIVARHRVVALAADGLRRAGIGLPPAIGDGAMAAARDALAMARETLRLQCAFDAAGIAAIFVKGSALALLAYGELGVKQSWDIDLLTAPAEALAGRHLLERLGYELVQPVLDDGQFARFTAFGKECIFFNPALGIAVELHWRLADNARLLAGVGPGAPAQHVRIGGGTVRTLADGPLFAFLCAHGTAHGWARLKWLADVGAFLSGRDAADIEQLHHEAVRLGAGRTPAVTLLLCHRLLGVALEPGLLRTLREDPKAEALAATAMRCIAHGGGAMEFGFYSRPGLRLTLSHFALAPGGRYFWNELGRLWVSGTDRARIALPRPLNFLYHILRLPLLVSRLGKRLFSRLGR